METARMPNYRKPEENVSAAKFRELVARVEALEKALEEKRGRKKAESED